MDKNKVSFYDMLRAADMVMKNYDNDFKPLYFDAEGTIDPQNFIDILAVYGYDDNM